MVRIVVATEGGRPSLRRAAAAARHSGDIVDTTFLSINLWESELGLGVFDGAICHILSVRVSGRVNTELRLFLQKAINLLYGLLPPSVHALYRLPCLQRRPIDLCGILYCCWLFNLYG